MENLKTVLKLIGKENVKFPIKETNDFLCTPIESLCLDNRTYNALCRNGIRTVGDITHDTSKLRKIRGFGAKCFSRLMYEICAFQYSQLGKEDKAKYLQRIVDLNLR